MVTSPDADQLRETLQSLKLESMADNLDALCEQAAKEEWTYAQYHSNKGDRFAKRPRRFGPMVVFRPFESPF